MTYDFAAADRTALGSNRAYCFEGDMVRLSADVNFSADDLAAGGSWSLQLWASPHGFDTGLNGVKVADLALQPAPGAVTVSGFVTALPPAGSLAQVMGLALVSFAADGRDRVLDLQTFPTKELFVQPQLMGELSCKFADAVVDIRVGGVANPRPADNLSGSLVLQLWSLDVPYAGGSWAGTLVASIDLGVLAGGTSWAEREYSLPCVPPDAANPVAAMLREWTPAGYVTRDFRNLPPRTKSGAAATPSAAPAATTKVTEAEEPPAKTSGKGKSSAANRRAVAINSASEGEIAAVKGIGARLAHAIVAARPFSSIEDLCRAKGMGPKLLEKVRSLLRL